MYVHTYYIPLAWFASRSVYQTATSGRTSFDDDHSPPVLSSRTPGLKVKEVTYNELVASADTDKKDHAKIRFFGERAAADGLEFF